MQISGAVAWAKGRKKPAPDVVNRKAEEFVADATEAVVPDALTPELQGLSADEMSYFTEGLNRFREVERGDTQ